MRLNEKGTPVDYLVVNQGIPEDSPLYDASCEGTWLLRKDISEIGYGIPEKSTTWSNPISRAG